MIASCARTAFAMLLLVFASATRAEDRTKVLEGPVNFERGRFDWGTDPFQAGGYTHPSAARLISQAERDAACERIHRAFEARGFKIKRDVLYDRDGVTFRPTGYDAERKVGFVWGTPETLGAGFFGNPAEATDEAKRRLLSAAEAKLLEDRAPQTREFIAVIIPFNHRLGYRAFSFQPSTEEHKQLAAQLEKQYAADEEKRLAALDSGVNEYVEWVASRRAEDYPAPSSEPRNLLSAARWSNCRDPHYPFGICGNGLFHALPEKYVQQSMQTWGTEAKLDLTKPFVYKTKTVSLTITGFDPQRKIGYVWSAPPDDETQRKEFLALAAQAEADGLRIAWISSWDGRFDNARPAYGGEYRRIFEELIATAKIADEAQREAVRQELQEKLSWEHSREPLQRLERRWKEFFEWAEKR